MSEPIVTTILDPALEEAIDAAAVRLLNAMFISGVTAAEAILHREHDTEQWRRAKSYAKIVLAPEPVEISSFGRKPVTLVDHRDACRQHADVLAGAKSWPGQGMEVARWRAKADAAQVRIDAGEVNV